MASGAVACRLESDSEHSSLGGLLQIYKEPLKHVKYETAGEAYWFLKQHWEPDVSKTVSSETSGLIPIMVALLHTALEFLILNCFLN